MAVEFFAKKTVGGLVPVDEVSSESMAELPMGKEIRVKATVARSNPQHRWFEKCIHFLFEHQSGDEPYPTRYLFRNKVKEWLGFGTWYTIKERKYFDPCSFAHHVTDQTEFNQVVHDFVRIVSEHIIPRMPRKEVVEMLLLLDADTGVIGDRIIGNAA